jgi:hypothetical protein
MNGVPFQTTGYLAIIPPRPEEDWLTDAVATREMPLHLASLIGIVALFVVVWVLFSDDSSTQRELRTAKGSQS